MNRLIQLFPLVLMIGTSGCNSRDTAGQRALDQLAELQKKKAAAAEARKDDNKLAPLPLVETVKLEAPYNDDASTRITPDGPCPEGFWALFMLEAPGASPEEKKINEANRKSIAEGLKAKQYIVKLRVGSGVTLRPFDPPKGVFLVEVQGTVDCTDARGRIAIAWSEPKATSRGQPGAPAQWYWGAPPVVFTLPMKSMLEAKAFETENRVALSARVVFTAGKTEVDKRLTKVDKVSTTAGSDDKVEYGGGMEDWGAGRLVRAQLIGVRVAVDRERKQLFDMRGSTQ